MSQADAAAANSTYFVKSGRASAEELAGQMRRSLDDPCVKIVLDAVSGFFMILNECRQILAANRELLEALGREHPRWLVGLRSGDAFNCIHFPEGMGGCGTSQHCGACGAALTLLAAQVTGAPGQRRVPADGVRPPRCQRAEAARGAGADLPARFSERAGRNRGGVERVDEGGEPGRRGA